MYEDESMEVDPPVPLRFETHHDDATPSSAKQSDRTSYVLNESEFQEVRSSLAKILALPVSAVLIGDINQFLLMTEEQVHHHICCPSFFPSCTG